VLDHNCHFFGIAFPHPGGQANTGIAGLKRDEKVMLTGKAGALYFIEYLANYPAKGFLRQDVITD
jgi:hypothetical protein